MPETHFKVKVESDHVRKLTTARPIPALGELIWNASDADATRVDVEIDKNDLGMQAITVRNNGHGIPHKDIEQLFGKLGGSWKAHGSRSKTRSRILHGKEGKGRFKALALGRVADWAIIYRDEDGALLRYTVTLLRDDLVDVRVSEPKRVDQALHPGVEVRITELDRVYRSLDPDQAINALAQIFALYLTDYSDLSIFVEQERVDPSKFITAEAETAFKMIRWADTNGAPVCPLLWLGRSLRSPPRERRAALPLQGLQKGFHDYQRYLVRQP
jgi:Histidine kinase-, DNA gyrase B-, and HSP90-like ATPase